MNKKYGRFVAMLWLLVIMTGPISGAQTSPGQVEDDARALLQNPMDNGRALVWYLGHCGYAVKTSNHLLIFDYTEKLQTRGGPPVIIPEKRSLETGWIDPKELQDQDVVVFVSHSHGDHYHASVIDTWEKEIPKIRYVYGWSEKSDAIHFSLAAPRAVLKQADLEVITVNSQHSGVPESAFLVKTDGLVLYHNGDYYAKMSADGPVMVDQDLAYLKTHTTRVDIMFIASSDAETFVKLIKGLDPQLIFPMHYGNVEEKYQDYPEALKRKGVVAPVSLPARRGDRFHDAKTLMENG